MSGRWIRYCGVEDRRDAGEGLGVTVVIERADCVRGRGDKARPLPRNA
jgi:hypothetical protein